METAGEPSDPRHEEPAFLFRESDPPIVAVTRSSRASRAAAPLAYHAAMEIQFVRRGQGAYFIRNRSWPLERNTLLVIPPDVPHRFLPAPDRTIEKTMVLFDPALLAGERSPFSIPRPGALCLRVEEPLVTELDVLLRTLELELGEHRRHRAEAVAALLRLLMLLLRRVQEGQPAVEEDRENPIVGWLTGYLEKHFREDLPLAFLARKAGYSRFYLARLFKRQTGLTIKQYILQRRIAEAKRRLLDDPARTVEALAGELGFGEFGLFNRAFKKLTGLTPTEYRKISHPADNS